MNVQMIAILNYIPIRAVISGAIYFNVVVDNSDSHFELK